jgi:hypothetical protein
MAYNIPDDLVQLRRAFVAAEQQLAELSKPGGDPQEWHAVYQESGDLAEKINTHGYWTSPDVDNRYRAWMALQQAAKETPV